jgi:hypothetical protein
MELLIKILPESRALGTQYWITALFVVCLTLLAWVRTAYPKKIPLLFKEVFTGEIPIKEKSITPPAVVLFVVFLCCTALLTVKALPFFVKKSFDNQAEGFLTIGGALLLFYLAKTVVLFVMGIIFDEQSAAWEYISEIYVFAHLMAIVLLPFVAIMFYSYGLDHRVFGEAVLIVIGALLAWRTIKMFILMTNKGLRVMYLFLYICGLEIVPIALFIKYGLMNHLK